MVKQFADGLFTNRPFGFHICTDSECLESVQKTITVTGFALFVHLLRGFGTYLQNLYFSLPTSLRNDCPPFYHCFKTYTLQLVNITCCVGKECITGRFGKQKLLYLNPSHTVSCPRNILAPKCLPQYKQMPGCSGYLVILMQTLRLQT